MIHYKPHCVEVYQPADVSAELAPAIEDTAPHTRCARVRCLLYPEAVDTAFRATGVEMSEPWKLFCELCDAHLFVQGAHVIFGDRRLVVRSRPQIFDLPLATAHATVRLEALAREENVL